MMPNLLAEATVFPEWVVPLTNLGLSGFVIWWLTTKVIPDMRADRKQDITELRADRAEVLAAFREEAREQRDHDARQTDLLRDEIRNIAKVA